MATQKQVNELMQLFAGAHPKQMNQNQNIHSTTGMEGMLGVLIYLYRAEGTVTSGMISKVMHVTTGRVSTLLKKMERKGLITRETGKEDARVTEVQLTDQGRRVIEDLDHQRTAQMEKLIDTIGMDKLREYTELSKKIWSILTPLSPNI